MGWIITGVSGLLFPLLLFENIKNLLVMRLCWTVSSSAGSGKEVIERRDLTKTESSCMRRRRSMAAASGVSNMHSAPSCHKADDTVENHAGPISFFDSHLQPSFSERAPALPLWLG